MLRLVINSILYTMFPQKCLGCGEILDYDSDYLCDYCYEMISKVNTDKVCIICGNQKEACRCKTRVFHYNGCTAPFYNQDIVQRIMYNYKFNHLEQTAEFFARKMVVSVKQAFADVRFDLVCAVPMRFIEVCKRGYNQSDILARRIAQLMDIPFDSKALRCHKKKRRQHTVKLNERFENVKGIYFTNKSFNGKIILLVDDIKTTGATLDQCARQLLIAGAEKVYCVAGVISPVKKGKTNGN